MKNLLISFFILIFLNSFAQKESYNWYFGSMAGISFNNGAPTSLLNSSMSHNFGCATISDSIGNLLFYTNGMTVWNKNHQPMPNGSGLLGSVTGYQNCMIVPIPEKSDQYYIFTVGTCDDLNLTCVGLHYSVLKLNLNNGLGDIDPLYKNIPLTQSDKAIEKITAVRHSNGKDFWIIVRNLSEPDNEFHSYNISGLGINSIPVRSSCLIFVPPFHEANRGALKISPDGNFIVSLNVYAFSGTYGNEIGFFDATNGQIDLTFTFLPVNFDEHGAEFSPNNHFLYISNPAQNSQNRILQFDITKLSDVSTFMASQIEIGAGGRSSCLQAGPDGKIYVARHNKEYLGVINNPELQGTACDYDSLGVYLGGRYCKYSLPQFIQTYFLRFEYEGNCVNGIFTFTPNFNPVPDSIHWDFGDPASGASNYSNDLNPQHTYSEGGDYTVIVFVRFPDGRTETATREVNVSDLPHPYPGNDTIVCEGTLVTLLATPGFESYLWNTGSISSAITVADTGYYWIEAMNAEGCTGRDTVHVAWFAEPQLDSVPVVSPTTCGSSIGAITGVTISGGSPPYSVRWVNSIGDTIGTTNNIYNLGVDNYYLWVTDLHGCQVQEFSCDIQNFDSDLIITNVPKNDTWCNQPLGTLNVEVQMGLSDRLFYSIDDWATWQTNGEFNNLLPNPYFVKVKDSLGCVAVYSGNPVFINNLPGLSVTGVNIVHETDNDADGIITIIASGDALLYSLDGAAPQSVNQFTSLTSGDYTVTVTDMHGCDSTFLVEVERITAQTLFATAGDTAVCNGLRASEPLLVSNFKDITSFEITLHYNNLLLDAIGYINAHDDLISGLEPVNYPSAGMIKIKWTGTGPVTFPDNTVMLDLVMQAKIAGLSTVDWVLTSNETNFVNQHGVAVQVIPKTGRVVVAPTPEIVGFYQETVCEFGTLSQMAFPTGGTGTSTITWETPHGTATGPEYRIDTARLGDAGFYRIKVIDQMNCVATDSVEVTVIQLPAANFPTINDTIPFEQHFTLEATPGYFSYEWNTGDTTYFITGTEEGNYSVIIKTAEGCTTIDSAYLKDIYMPFYFNVPNAFTPNGDGLNDTFRPVATGDLIRQFSMVIYNRWGQLIFETSNPAEGWNGKDAPTGVYSWVISYSDYLGKVFKMSGSVTLLK
jgi:gliding motility-associated-like protein